MSSIRPPRSSSQCNHVVLLGRATKGFKGTIVAINALPCVKTGLPSMEIERRLMEMGFIVGTDIEIMHEGFWGRDPIAVRVNGTTVALRRRIANAVRVCPASCEHHG